MKIKSIDLIYYGSGGAKMAHSHFTKNGIKIFEAKWRRVRGDAKVLYAVCPSCKRTHIFIERRK